MREGAKGHSMKHSIAAQCEAPPFFVFESEAALHSMESARPRSNTEKPLARSLPSFGVPKVGEEALEKGGGATEEGAREAGSRFIQWRSDISPLVPTCFTLSPKKQMANKYELPIPIKVTPFPLEISRHSATLHC